MSEKKDSMLDYINSRPDKDRILELRSDIPEYMFEELDSTLIDASKLQLIPVGMILELGIINGINFESKHIKGMMKSPSESILLDILLRIKQERMNMVIQGYDNNRKSYSFANDMYDIDEPIQLSNALLAYTRNKKWIDVGDYVQTLHQGYNLSPYHYDIQDIRIMKNGKIFRPFSYCKGPDMNDYLDDLCDYLSSYSNKVSWSEP